MIIMNVGNIELYCISILIFFISLFVQIRFKSKINKLSKQKLYSCGTGAEMAERMLHDNGIYDVKVVSTDGILTDNYNPLNKTVNLSSEVFYGSSVAAVAVAAHECGHAVQHNKNYVFLHLRSVMVPVFSFSAKFVTMFLLIGFFMINISLIPLKIAICLYAMVTLFTFITLPIELDASNIALNWIETNEIVKDKEYKDAESALKLAAMTYVLAALAALTELLRLISIITSRRDD